MSVFDEPLQPEDAPGFEDWAFPTAEEAALAGFDPRYARHVRTTMLSEDLAEVELATNEPPTLYPYFVQCERQEDGRWIEVSSHN